MSFAKRVARNSIILVGTHVLTFSISIVVLGALGRYLGPEGNGRFEYVGSVLSYFFLFASFGMDMVLIREIAREREKTGEYLSAVLSLKTVFIVVVTAAFYCYTLLFEQEALRQPLLLCGIAILFTAWSNSFQAVFNAHEKMGLRGAVLLFLNVVQFIGVFLLIWLGKGLTWAVFVYHVLGSLSGVLMAAHFVHHRFAPIRLGLDFSLWKRFLKKSYSFFSTNLAGVTYFRADIIFVEKLLASASITGWFAPPKRILEALYMLTSALTHSLYPALAHRFSQSSEDRGEVLRQMSKMILLIAFPMGLFVYFNAHGIIDLIWGLEQFARSGEILGSFGPVVTLLVYDTLIMSFALLLDLEHSVRRVQQVRIALMLLCDGILIWKLGVSGAVYAMAISNLFNTACCLWLIRRHLGPLRLPGSAMKPLVINVLFALLLYPMRNWHVLLATAAAGAAYLVLLWMFRELTREKLIEIGILKQ